MPEQGEIILATVTKVMDHGAYVTLDEYDDIQGFLHISEIAPGWIRSVSRFVKDGEKKVLLSKFRIRTNIFIANQQHVTYILLLITGPVDLNRVISY